MKGLLKMTPRASSADDSSNSSKKSVDLGITFGHNKIPELIGQTTKPPLNESTAKKRKKKRKNAFPDLELSKLPLKNTFVSQLHLNGV